MDCLLTICCIEGSAGNRRLAKSPATKLVHQKRVLRPKKSNTLIIMTANQKLFTPFRLGPLSLSHRIVMAPLTRLRSEEPGDVPGDMMREYYCQRASRGGLIVSEGTTVSITGRGYLGAPGIYSDDQVAGWKKVTDAVHANGGYF